MCRKTTEASNSCSLQGSDAFQSSRFRCKAELTGFGSLGIQSCEALVVARYSMVHVWIMEGLMKLRFSEHLATSSVLRAWTFRVHALTGKQFGASRLKCFVQNLTAHTPPCLPREELRIVSNKSRPSQSSKTK